MHLQRKECRSREIAALLKEDILRGKIPPGAPLASIRSLASSFEVSSQVIVSAFDLLEKDRLIQSQPRRGFRVSDPLPRGRFLIVTYDAADDASSTANYIITEFESLCRSQGIGTEKIPVDILRSADPELFSNKLTEKGFSGILLCGCSFIGREPEIRLLRSAGIPVLQPTADVCDRDITRFAAIAKDNDSLWFEALSFLKKKGFKKIGAIGQFSGSGIIGRESNASLRCRPINNHFSMMRQLDLEIPEDPLLFLNLKHKKECDEKLSLWLEDHKRFDAIICHSDFYAAVLYDFCRKQKISIPEELAVIGFGDFPGNELLSPPLTSINFMVSHVVKTSLQLLLESDKWFNTNKIPCVTPSFQIMERQSTSNFHTDKGGKKK